MLNREAILSFQDRQVQKVHIPEWADDVYVRSLSGAERDAFEEGNLIRERNKKSGAMNYDVRLQNAKVRLVILTLCDEQGNRLLEDSDEGVLAGKNAAAINRIYSVAASMSGITDEDLEELLKN